MNRINSWRKLMSLVRITRQSFKRDVVLNPEVCPEHNSDSSDIEEEEEEDDDFSQTSELTSHSTLGVIPPLNIVIMVVGTRGDVQPFVALGLELQKYGHRVRIASHKVYRGFVIESGLEFYPLGGDPKMLIEQLVRNKGIVAKSIKDIRFSRRYIKEIVYPCIDACISPDPGDPDIKPFKADAIIANPPAQGHIHCAEALGIPVHLMFTMPWTPTKYFPNPMARIWRENLANQMQYLSKRLRQTIALGKPADGESNVCWENQASYHVVDDFVWMGTGDIINRFRRKLGLKALYGAYHQSKLLNQKPWTYCWSTALLQRPPDWGENVKVAGFFFYQADLTKYRPPSELKEFLQAGSPPIFFGFGSLIFKRSKQINNTIIRAVKQLKIRAIIQRGWCGLGEEGLDEPNENILYVDACPHDWLFPQCAAVVHHGGAGTTASGLLAGCPTMIVPFFGDQAFWGEACYNAGVGPAPVNSSQLTQQRLIDAINFMMKEDVQTAARNMRQKLQNENGIRDAVENFHLSLPIESIIRKELYGSCATRQDVMDDSDMEPCTLSTMRNRVLSQMYGLFTYRRTRSYRNRSRGQRRQWIRRRVSPTTTTTT
eukprot:TRINITY_DN4838_c0_g1_i2.p1 TRINITY_DN4838_c0_g1~~TRINITY_DN4838_c0_g1_i2.p1  ORF type:complete len:683 (-),score=66.03 TRINITY_DN4838_c0_g1_i2:183-1982(-)